MALLRELTPDDAEAHVAGEDEQIVRWLNEGMASTVESTRRWIARHGDVHRGAVDGEHVFAIELDGRLAGMAALDATGLDGATTGDVNVSYAVQPWARRRGVATRAVRQAARVAIDRGLGERLLLRIDPRNVASLAVAHSVGVRLDGETTTGDGTRLQLWRARLDEVAAAS
ncbi:GNAT family N-acetyltransferase [Oerskovia turbata]